MTPKGLVKLARRTLADRIKRLGLKEAALRLSYRRGLPPGLDRDRLDEIVRELTDGALAGARFRHMSGWKNTGAYRMVLKTSSRPVLTMVYKNAEYSDLEIPALDGLLIQPGVGEYFFFTHAAGPLAKFLPQVLLAEEVTPRVHYRYLMQDLSLDHRNCVGARDTIAICAILPELHRAMQAAAAAAPQAPLVRFDRDFDSQLLGYASRSLEAYQSARADPSVEELLRNWTAVAALYARSSEAAHALQALTTVHGDFNTSNVMVHRGNGSIKVLDLEWAGWGLPHVDLASALIQAPSDLEEECLARFNRQLGDRPLAEDRLIYLHAVLHRSLLNASFVAKQSLCVDKGAPAWFPEFVSRASRNALATFERLNASSSLGATRRGVGRSNVTASM